MIVLITGPSGAGKSTFVGKLMEQDPRLAFSVSTTTRPIREGEVDGRDYDFITDEAEFLRLRDEGAFVEWARVHDNFYGTRRSQLDEMAAAGKIPLLDIDVQGGVQVIDIYGPELVSVFLFPPSAAPTPTRSSPPGWPTPAARWNSPIATATGSSTTMWIRPPGGCSP